MTEQPKDGGPAFACMAVDASGDRYGEWGMSLRDWFAGQAIAAMVKAAWDDDWPVDANAKIAATWAYAVSDAMLAARGAK